MGGIFNAGDNVDDKEDYGFITSFFKIAPTVIDDYLKKLLNMQLENFRPQRNMENIDKQSDERNQINMIDDREYDDIDKIGRNEDETLNTDTEVLKLGKFSSQKNIDNIDKQSDEEIGWI